MGAKGAFIVTRLPKTLLLLCLLLAPPTPGSAQPIPGGVEIVGVVERVKGHVYIHRYDERRAAVPGSGLAVGDLLETMLTGRVEVRLADNSMLFLSDLSRIEIIDLETAAGREYGVLRLVSGTLRVITGFIAGIKPHAFAVDTPVATIGIRGTDFWVGPMKNEMGVVLFSGEIVVRNPRGEVSLSRPGEATSIAIRDDSGKNYEEKLGVGGVDLRSIATSPRLPSVLADDELASVLATVTF